MEAIPCSGCGAFFHPRNKLQQYCSKSQCQGIRKALWQRNKINSDPQYKADQRFSHEKWLKSRPTYWKEYRARNPSKVKRNRLLQKVRNRGLHKSSGLTEAIVIAKMDAGKPLTLPVEEAFWLIPAVAKMDATKLIFRLIPDHYEKLQR